MVFYLNQMTTYWKKYLPCPKCQSSDALTVYTDGHSYCFSCKGLNTISKEQLTELGFEGVNSDSTPEASYHSSSPPASSSDSFRYSYQYLATRGITEDTMRKFNCLTKVSEEGLPLEIGFPYDADSTSVKVRNLTEKSFWSKGDMRNATLFGKHLFPAASSRSITITEGEFDALSVYQMLGSGYPVVSIRSSSSGKADCQREFEYLNSFERIYLCLDADEPGQKAALEIARLFDFNKIYHVKLDATHKDANGYLQANQSDVFKRTWWNSKRYVPEGVLSQLSEFDDIIDHSENKVGVPFPFPTLQEKTYGIRTGETYLFTALEGIGKTEIIRAIEYHLLRTTDSNIGVIHLEEGKDRVLKGLAGYELGAPAHLPDSGVSNDDVKGALHNLIKRDERLHIYSHFGSADPDHILDTIRFLVASCNCKYVFLDHITMVVSGLKEDDERKALDYISTRLAMMVEELDFALIFVSHINDHDQTRGSRNISKVAKTWIKLSRDQNAATEEERNTTLLTIQKNRFGAHTGPAGKLYFDLNTFMISETQPTVLPPVSQ